MFQDPTFDRLVSEALAAPFEGWDFSWLKGRKTELDLPWDYVARVKQRIRSVDSMLDMGTGGGEVLASLAPLPPHTCATEGYAPNIPVARRRLEALGVTVYDTTDDQENARLPFADEEFDLVINRHESYVPAEIRRILRPDGRFITQQCGGYGEVDVIEFFQGPTEPMDSTLVTASRQLEEAGFLVLDGQEVYPEYKFLDIGAVVYYLRAIPWLLDDFTVERYRDRLIAMHEHIQKHGGFTVKNQPFFIAAERTG
jgi:SAM-dependent methyltransferase